MPTKTVEPAVSTEREEEDRVEEEEEQEIPNPGCGIMGRYPVLSVLLFAAVGIAIGLGMSYWEPDDMEKKNKALKWLGLIGDLFIRALKAVVLPLVFINVVISVVDMMTVGKAGSIGWKTIGLYFLTTIIASILGIISIVAFKPLFAQGDFPAPPTPTVSLGCNAAGTFLAEFEDGSVSCTADLDNADNTFYIEDLTGTFVQTSSGAADDISLSDTIYEGVFTKLVPSNIFVSFVGDNFAAVVFFAIFFGVALSRVLDQQTGENDISFLMKLFGEIDKVLIMLINCTYYRISSCEAGLLCWRMVVVAFAFSY